MVKSNVAWDYTVSDGWLHAEKQPDRLIISAEDNDQKNIRRATVTITVPDLPAHTVEVQQLGWGKAIRGHYKRRGRGVGRTRLHMDL